MKDVEHVLRDPISIYGLIRRRPHRRRMGYCDPRALRYVPRYSLNQSVLNVLPCWWRGKLQVIWRWLERRPAFLVSGIDIFLFLFLSVFRVISVISRVVISGPSSSILESSSSLPWGSMVKTWVPKRWMLLWATLRGLLVRVRLGGPLRFVHLHVGGLAWCMMC